MRAVPVVVDLPCGGCHRERHGRDGVEVGNGRPADYAVPGSCANCGQRAIGMFTLGHPVSHGQECPTCRCEALRWDTSAPPALTAPNLAGLDAIPPAKVVETKPARPRTSPAKEQR